MGDLNRGLLLYNKCLFNVSGAINAVVTYSMNGVELLKRRKLKRDLLFRYLVSVNVAVDPRAGKVQLAKTILEHWGTRNVDILDLMEVGHNCIPV